VDLDDQLAALAAGELDDDTARALRARTASDPALAQRLARLEQLERLLRSWDPPAMSPEAAARLDARIDAALDELDDAPLAAQGTATSLAPLAAAGSDDGPEPAATGGAAAADDDTVVDLAAERERRGLPAWASGLAIAAALAAVVGAGIVFGGLPGGADLDILAESDDDTGADSAERAEQAEEESASDSAAITGGDQDSSVGTYQAPAETMSDATAPRRLRGVDIALGELLQLADTEVEQHAAAGDEPAAGDGEASDDGAASCIEEALRRDTDPDGDPQLQLLADGTYDGQDAVFVVLRTATASGDRIQVLAYDPGDCSLLDAEETTG